MDQLIALVLVAGALWFYLLPAYIAHQRNHRNKLAIVWLDILLGWTFLGWVAALV